MGDRVRVGEGFDVYRGRRLGGAFQRGLQLGGDALGADISVALDDEDGARLAVVRAIVRGDLQQQRGLERDGDRGLGAEGVGKD